MSPDGSHGCECRTVANVFWRDRRAIIAAHMVCFRFQVPGFVAKLDSSKANGSKIEANFRSFTLPVKTRGGVGRYMSGKIKLHLRLNLRYTSDGRSLGFG